MDVVQIPRKCFTEALWSLAFSALQAKARAGECGMEALVIPDKANMHHEGTADGPASYVVENDDGRTNTVIRLPPDVAYMRGDRADKTWLYVQNW